MHMETIRQTLFINTMLFASRLFMIYFLFVLFLTFSTTAICVPCRIYIVGVSQKQIG